MTDDGASVGEALEGGLDVPGVGAEVAGDGADGTRGPDDVGEHPGVEELG